MCYLLSYDSPNLECKTFLNIWYLIRRAIVGKWELNFLINQKPSRGFIFALSRNEKKVHLLYENDSYNFFGLKCKGKN